MFSNVYELSQSFSTHVKVNLEFRILKNIFLYSLTGLPVTLATLQNFNTSMDNIPLISSSQFLKMKGHFLESVWGW